MNTIKRCILFLLSSLWALQPLRAQENSGMKGIVQTEKGIALQGVSVTATNMRTKKTVTTATNEKGLFQINTLTVGSVYDFLFTHTGYANNTVKDIKILASNDNSLLVRMTPSFAALDQVVVIGYGNQKKSNITSSISTVKMTEVDQGSSYNGVKMLEGRASGVNIITPAGTPGTPAIVMIRGIGSISGGSAPLYVVDGLPNETFPNLNPNDIESMEVLKDASAAAIYGSRANSGVIIITTRSGKGGRTSVNASFRNGFGNVYHDIKMANSTQYAQVMQAAVDNYNAEKGANLTFYKPSSIQETNWVKQISRTSAITNAFDVNVAGGNERTKLYASFGGYGQQGILRTSDFQQYNLRIKVSHEISKYIAFNANLSGSFAPQRLVEENNTSLKVLRNAREEQPWYSPYLADGSYKVNGTYILRHSPVMEENEEKWTRGTYEGLGSVSLDITPIKGLKYTPSISAWGTLVDERKKLSSLMAARAQSAGWGALLEDRNMGVRYVFDNILTYDNSWNKLNYTVMAGHSYEKYTYDLFGAYSSNYANGAYPSSNLDIINAGPNIYADPASNGYNAYNLESYLGRINLDYNGKYLLNASVRRDGSSKFSSNDRFGAFPSLSLGWKIIKEPFWKINEKIVSDLKLRASYGETGSMAGIGYYAPLALVSSGNSYNNQGGFILSQDAQNVTWEKAKQFDIGLDVAFLKGRINLTTDYFNQKTTNLLYNKPVYATSGYSNIAANIGALRNQGFELATSIKVLSGQIKWDVGANISFVQNKLLSLYDKTNMYIIPASGLNQIGGQMHALIVGKPIGAFYMLKQTGIYQNDKDVSQTLYTKGVRAGDVKYQDVNSDGDIGSADLQYVGKATPDYFGGLTSNLSWKGFELNLFAQFAKGNKIMASWRGVNSEGAEHLGDALSNVKTDGGQTVEQYYNISQHAATTYWHGPGTSNTTPRPVRNGVFSGYSYSYNLLPSSRQLEDGSYFKLKTVTMAYNLPGKLTKKWSIENIRLFISADNVFTITKYSGYDPEQSFATNPGDANYGVDFGLQAALRTFIFGINVKF